MPTQTMTDTATVTARVAVIVLLDCVEALVAIAMCKSTAVASQSSLSTFGCLRSPAAQHTSALQFATAWPGSTRGMATDTKGDNMSYNR